MLLFARVAWGTFSVYNRLKAKPHYLDGLASPVVSSFELSHRHISILKKKIILLGIFDFVKV
jgi:hypothetical protein